jgi:hypothetical protein
VNIRTMTAPGTIEAVSNDDYITVRWDAHDRRTHFKGLSVPATQDLVGRRINWQETLELLPPEIA